MSAIFNALPGIEVPVGSIKHSLTNMWATTAAKGGAAPASDDAKATQVNFVMHLGLNTSTEDAVAQFQTAVVFSRRYPCRVVVFARWPMTPRPSRFAPRSTASAISENRRATPVAASS